MSRNTAAKFWRTVAADKFSDCWLWMGGKDKDGYGKTKLNDKHVRAHRVAWELTYGKIEGELQVLHSCDTPACVKPAHLSLGTARDNYIDCATKGRHINPPSLSEEQKRYARLLYSAERRSKREIARFFDVSPIVISNAINRREICPRVT